MEAGLILGAFEVCAPEPVYCPVIPPNESADGDLDKIRKDYECPEFASTNVLGCKLHERRDVAVLIVKVSSSNDADRDQNGAADDTENNEDIPYHPQEPQEEDGVQSYLVHKILLFGPCDGLDPVEWAVAQRLRSVFLVGMFCSRCIYAIVLRSEEAEDKEKKTGDDEGVDDRGVNGTLLDLWRLLAFT